MSSYYLTYFRAITSYYFPWNTFKKIVFCDRWTYTTYDRQFCWKNIALWEILKHVINPITTIFYRKQFRRIFIINSCAINIIIFFFLEGGKDKHFPEKQKGNLLVGEVSLLSFNNLRLICSSFSVKVAFVG